MTKEELEKLRDVLSEKQAEDFIHIHTLSNLYAKQSFIEGFDACYQVMRKEIEALNEKGSELVLHTFDQSREFIELKEQMERTERQNERLKILCELEEVKRLRKEVGDLKERENILVEVLDEIRYVGARNSSEIASEILKKIRGEK